MSELQAVSNYKMLDINTVSLQQQLESYSRSDGQVPPDIPDTTTTSLFPIVRQTGKRCQSAECCAYIATKNAKNLPQLKRYHFQHEWNQQLKLLEKNNKSRTLLFKKKNISKLSSNFK